MSDTTKRPDRVGEPLLVHGERWGAPVRWLYIGGDAIIDSAQVVAVLDGEKARRSTALRRFMESNAEAGKVVDVSEGGSIKSLIITADRIYLSQVASPTVGRRANIIYLGEGEDVRFGV